MTPELRAACKRAVHVVLPSGEVLRAGRASLTVLQQLGWWWVRPLFWPPMIWFVELGYAIVARNRVFFSRYMFKRRD